MIEDLKRADSLLHMKKQIDFLPYVVENVDVFPDSNDLVVYGGGNPVLYGMYQAYADHRPFVLSPDIVWMMIAQGYAEHVKNNSEKLRNHFVDFKDKKVLTVISNQAIGGNEESAKKCIPQFIQQLSAHVNDSIVECLNPKFSTTDETASIAFQLSTMDGLSKYFEYDVLYLICGIPEITIEGTKEDWENILVRIKQLEKYELKWWIKEIEPIIKEFINVYEGKIDKRFWRNMCKVHSEKEYGRGNIIDGWIIKFFPYSDRGERMKFDEISFIHAVPSQLFTVDFDYIITDAFGKVISKSPMKWWAGFIGLEQDTLTKALKPKMAWLVTRESLMERHKDHMGMPHFYATSQWPDEVLNSTSIDCVRIDFSHKIIIPDELSKVQIHTLYLQGMIDEDQIKKLRELLPKCLIVINDRVIK